MAVHPNATSLTVEVIEEYLDIAKMCIATRKPDGGIYGYPATLLLFCVINALGNSLIGGNEPFRLLKQAPFKCGLDDRQVKQLEQWYRNLLAHNGMIAPGTCLSPDDSGAPFSFDTEELVLIRVKPLYAMVRSAWERIDKTRLNSGWKFSTNPTIRNPVFLRGASSAMPVTASGSMYAPPRTANDRAKKR